jgi:aerobic carbon-monoxide dehydrogenase medium subunit
VKPARFSYEAPTTVAGVLAALAAHSEAKIIAGGQSLAPMMNMRIAQPAHLVDISRVADLAHIRVEQDRLVCGALVRHADLARHELVRTHAPMLAYAAQTIGHYAIRQRGTLGGSLAHADPAAQLPLVAIALEATIEVTGEARRRTVPATEFISSIFTTVLEPQELLVAAHFPIGPPRGWGFRLFNRRAGDFALALVACSLARTRAGVADIRVAVGGIGPTPVRLDNAVEAGNGDAAWIARSARAVAAAAPIEENERSPVAYRRELVEALAHDALADAVGRAS